MKHGSLSASQHEEHGSSGTFCRFKVEMFNCQILYQIHRYFNIKTSWMERKENWQNVFSRECVSKAGIQQSVFICSLSAFVCCCLFVCWKRIDILKSSSYLETNQTRGYLREKFILGSSGSIKNRSCQCQHVNANVNTKIFWRQDFRCYFVYFVLWNKLRSKK